MSTQPGRPIIAGYAWQQRVRVTSTPATFPSDVALTAEVRRSLAANEPALATLTLGDGITRVDENTIELAIAGADSADWTSSAVLIDIVRTDTAEPHHLGFRLRVPVVQPVTRLET
jgi:hypothetical protein